LLSIQSFPLSAFYPDHYCCGHIFSSYPQIQADTLNHKKLQSLLFRKAHGATGSIEAKVNYWLGGAAGTGVAFRRDFQFHRDALNIIFRSQKKRNYFTPNCWQSP